MHLHRAAVDRVADQQDLEVWVLHVSVDTAGGEVGAAVSLDVDAYPVHSCLLSAVLFGFDQLHNVVKALVYNKGVVTSD